MESLPSRKKLLPEPVVQRFRQAIKNFPEENLPAAAKKLHEDIRQFQNEDYKKAHLHRQPVYFASINYLRRNSFFPYHGYLASGFPHPHTRRDRGRIYTFTIDLMKLPYEVTPAVLAQANNLNLPPDLKQALQEMRGKKFATVEYFLRELMVRHAEIDEDFISPAELEFNLHNPGKSLRDIVALNESCNNRTGSYAPMVTTTRTTAAEYRYFKMGLALYKEVNVAPLSLLEVLQEQSIYFRYLDEKLGIGKSMGEFYKLDRLRDIKDEEIKNLTGKWVEHIEFPKDCHASNCNSANATLLQYAMNREQKKSTLTYQPLQTATFFSFAKNHRMYMHDPLLVSECIAELEKYIKNREKYGDNFWGRLSGMTREVKLSAARKMILVLQQRIKASELPENEIAALKQGRLKGIIASFQLLTGLAKAKISP